MSFFDYIKAVGTGPRHNRNLSEIEIIDAMEQILEQKVCSEQIVAFLLGWRLQEESDVEMRGALKAFHKYIKRTTIPNSIELGNPFDGKHKRPYLFPLIAKEVKKFDLNLIISTDYLQPAKDGVTTKDICNVLKLEDNVYCFDRIDYFKQLSDLTQTRCRLGLRTGLNTIEKLLNPANSRFAITGAFHKPYVKKYLDLFSCEYENLVIVKGEEGTCEFFSKTKIWQKRNDKIIEIDINPKDFGIEYKDIWEKITLDEMKYVIENPSDSLLKIAKLNAALLLFTARKCKSIREGFELLL